MNNESKAVEIMQTLKSIPGCDPSIQLTDTEEPYWYVSCGIEIVDGPILTGCCGFSDSMHGALMSIYDEMQRSGKIKCDGKYYKLGGRCWIQVERKDLD